MGLLFQIQRIQAFKDGESWRMVFDDFVNPQESPSFFYGPETKWAAILDHCPDCENPAVYLPLIELARVVKFLEGEQ